MQATELVAGFMTGAISPVEATRAALEAIERYDERVNAFVLVDAEGALAAAKESEARWHSGEPLGPGDGVPTSIKDALWTRGWPTLRGSTMIDEAGPWDEDAPAVARLRETGAVILGKTTTPEYSWKGVTDSHRYGATGNPWDPSKTSVVRVEVRRPRSLLGWGRGRSAPTAAGRSGFPPLSLARLRSNRRTG